VLAGILNVTPDSFSDGGSFASVESAVAHARKLVHDGATIVDVGGESTRPGAQAISAEEQIERVVPVIHGIREVSDCVLSIDTTSARVAQAAIEVGAQIINDVSAGQDDPQMFELAASSGVGLVLMHRLLPPRNDVYSDQYAHAPHYEDVASDVLEWLLVRVQHAKDQGVSPSAIAIDPGLGFGKSVEQNMRLADEVNTFVASGYPVFVGASRKSFVGAVTGIANPNERDEASAAIARTMLEGGAQVFRVHDVRTHARVLQSHAHEIDTNRR
jgi:dihydropteroate synthase